MILYLEKAEYMIRVIIPAFGLKILYRNKYKNDFDAG
jgi:hypothetical protein